MLHTWSFWQESYAQLGWIYQELFRLYACRILFSFIEPCRENRLMISLQKYLFKGIIKWMAAISNLSIFNSIYLKWFKLWPFTFKVLLFQELGCRKMQLIYRRIHVLDFVQNVVYGLLVTNKIHLNLVNWPTQRFYNRN